ncbi:hypothetical protein PSD17_64460 [Pseudonocardia sp. D17]|nr:hypothetical protein PSD17_64460 [Pseudonocardia sp. D17]
MHEVQVDVEKIGLLPLALADHMAVPDLLCKRARLSHGAASSRLPHGGGWIDLDLPDVGKLVSRRETV